MNISTKHLSPYQNEALIDSIKNTLKAYKADYNVSLFKRIKALTLFLAIFIHTSLYAQEYYELYYESSSPDSELSFRLRSQVQNLEDFIERFNGYQNAYGEELRMDNPRFRKIYSNSQYWETWRRKIIGTLMDSRMLKKDSLCDHRYSKALAVLDPIKMDKTFSAFLPSEIVAFDTVYKVNIELKFIEIENEKFEWIIHDAHFFPSYHTPDIPALYTLPAKNNDNIYLPPNAHGNGFLLLKRKMMNNESLSPYYQGSRDIFKILDYIVNNAKSISFHSEYYSFIIKGTVAFRVSDEFSITSVDLLN